MDNMNSQQAESFLAGWQAARAGHLDTVPASHAHHANEWRDGWHFWHQRAQCTIDAIQRIKHHAH